MSVYGDSIFIIMPYSV